METAEEDAAVFSQSRFYPLAALAQPGHCIELRQGRLDDEGQLAAGFEKAAFHQASGLEPLRRRRLLSKAFEAAQCFWFRIHESCHTLSRYLAKLRQAGFGMYRSFSQYSLEVSGHSRNRASFELGDIIAKHGNDFPTRRLVCEHAQIEGSGVVNKCQRRRAHARYFQGRFRSVL